MDQRAPPAPRPPPRRLRWSRSSAAWRSRSSWKPVGPNGSAGGARHGNFVTVGRHSAAAAHGALRVLHPIKTVAPARFETLRLRPPPRNEALPGAGFRRDFRDGEITFRPCLHLGDGPLAPESGRSAPALVGCAVDHALPPRAAVALGRCTDAEFLARQNTQDGGNGFPFAFELRFTRWVGACSPAMATS